jgi:Jacalin-like lectin domain
MNLRHLARAIAFGCATLLCGHAEAGSCTFNTLTYNIAGTPTAYNGFSSTNTALLSCYVKPFNIVNVQEDFPWHAMLYDTCDKHPCRTPTSGTAGIGDGLNTLSSFRFDDLDRVTWTNRADSDALTPKGFSLIRVRLAEGVYVDFYNLHAQSGTSSTDLADSVSDVNQMLTYTEANSAGNAVHGDGRHQHPLHPRRPEHVGFPASWLHRRLWRNNGVVNLQAPTYVDRQDAVDGSGAQLSDHDPIEVDWSYTTATSLTLSDQFGGPHGTSYNDSSVLPPTPVVKQLTIQTGNRVDHVEIALSNGYVFSHGGSGGTAQTLTLASGEVLSAVNLCTAQYDGHTRVFAINFATSTGRRLSGGTTTSGCTTYTAPSGWQIVGFHGRSGDEVDKLGVVYAPVNAGAPGATLR